MTDRKNAHVDWNRPFQVGDFDVDPLTGTVTHRVAGTSRHLEPKQMCVLLCLARADGQPVSRDALCHECWDGRPVSDDPINVAIRKLRVAFDDDPRKAEYIKTLPKQGHLLTARVARTDRASPGGRVVDAPDEGNRWSGFFAAITGVLKSRLAGIAVVYAVSAWVVLQVGDVVSDALELHAGWMRLLIAVIVLGFPVVVTAGWLLLGQTRREFVVVAMAVATSAGVFLALQDFGESRPEPAPGPAPSPVLANSLAVLPFEFLAPDQPDPDRESLGHSLAREVIRMLSRLPELQVMSSRATFFYQDDNVPEIRDALRVRYLLDGRIQQQGEQLRIAVELTDTAGGTLVWSRSFTHTVATLFDLYDEMAPQIVDAMAIALSGDSRQILAGRATKVEQAYAQYLSGQALLDKPKDEPVLREAERAFVAAIGLDPDFAAAHAGLCETYLAWHAMTRSGPWLAQARQSCNRSIALDPHAPEVHLALGNYYRRTGAYSAAEVEFQRALALNANSFEAHMGLGRLRAAQERFAQAEEAFQVALRLQPGNWIIHTVYGLYLMESSGDYAGAEKSLRVVTRLRPDSKAAFNNLGAAQQYQDKFQEAAQSYEKSLQLDSTDNATAHSNLGVMYYYLGLYDDAVIALCRGVDTRRDDHRIWGNLALSVTYSTADGNCVNGRGPRAAKALYERALALAREWVAGDSKDADTHADMATYYAELGDLKNALASIEKALRFSSADPTVHYLTAVTYETLQRRSEAVLELETAFSKGQSRRIVESDARLSALVKSRAYRCLWQAGCP